MQLFDDCHKVLRDCVGVMKGGSDEVHPDDILSAETRLQITSAGASDEEQGEVRIRVGGKKPKKAPKWDEITQHAEDFCGSVLSFAVNPVVDGQPKHEEGAEPVSIEGGSQPGAISITGPASAFMGRQLADIESQIGHYEKLMFNGWEATEHPTIIEKRFNSEEEASRTMHLLHTMGLAFGFTEKAVENSFHESSDDLTIRLDKRFLKTLAEREKTFEASIEL